MSSNKAQRIANLSPVKQAIFALDEMQAKLDSFERQRNEPIAIVGMSCRFPGGADEPEGFWRILRDGVDTVREVPADRWDINSYYDPNPDASGKMYTRWGAFLDGVDQFDPKFFGIAPREAMSMDPQQRLLMEVTWEALENAGQVPERLKGNRTGVFVGMMTHDYYHLITRGNPSSIDAYYGTGNGGSSAAGRLSYNFGLQGPSISIDTACSSSLVTLHLASQSLRDGDCQLAIAAAVNLILSPDVTIYLCRAKALSAAGRCKTFDASADGYVRGEGCGVVVLKLLSQALVDGDNILALIRGSAVRHDGRSSGFTVPNGTAQQSLIQDVLAHATILPGQVSYVEAHGTGTSLGDPIEMDALTAVFGRGRNDNQPLMIGSVKTNIGHSEAAAGMAGLIKVVLSLQHETIPPHLHLKTLNPHISLTEMPLLIPLKAMPWPRTATPRIAGISSFGLSGTIAHLIVEEAPPGVARVAAPLAESAWQRQRCWIESAKTGKSHTEMEPTNIGLTRHTLLGQHTMLAHPSESHLWEVTLNRQLLAYLDDHRIQGVVVLPGAAYVEMALSAASEMFGEGDHVLTDIEFQHALFLPEEGTRVVQVTSSADSDGRTSFLIHSRPAGTPRRTANWTLHASGKIFPALKGDPPRIREEIELDDIQARCSEVMDGETYYLKLREWGFQYGPQFQGIERLWQGRGEVLGSVRNVHAPDSGGVPYRLHPALLDACLQAGWSQLLQTDAEQETQRGETRRTLMPVRLGEVRVYGHPGQRLWSYAKRRPQAAQTGERFEADFRLFDDEGHLVAEILDARAQYLDYKPAVKVQEHADDWFYELQWRHVENEDGHTRPREVDDGRTWLIFADARGVGAALTARLRERGDRCVLVAAGDKYERLDVETFSIRPAQPEDMRHLFADALAGREQVCHGVVHLWSLDAPPTEEITTRSLELDQMRGPVTVLHMVQELALRRWEKKPQLWLVTRGAQAVEKTIFPLAVAQSMLWGFGRTVAAEHHDYWGGLIDLDPEGGAIHAGLLLCRELDAASADDQVAFRGEQRYVARLVRRPSATMPSLPLRWRADGSYLITGGLGELGLEVARWMVGQGARRLILLGRTPLPPRAEWNECPPEGRSARQIAAIRELEVSGASVHLAFLDVSDEDQVRSFVDEFRLEGWPPIRGVVYAAGQIEVRTLAELNAELLCAVLRAKVIGSWLFHSLLSADELDFFVFFSSASSLLNSPRLAGYAAANAFLDGLAHYREFLGQRALSINWGPWAEVGMVARVEQPGQSAIKSIESIAPHRGLEILGRLLQTTVPQVAVLPIDWTNWKNFYASASRMPFFAEVTGELADPNDTGAHIEESSIGWEILDAKENDQRGLLESYLCRQVAQVLRLDPLDIHLETPLTSLGLDSLMSIEIKNRIETNLEVALPMVTLLQGPSVAELATHLLGQLKIFVSAHVTNSGSKDLGGEQHEPRPDRMSRIDQAEATHLLAKFDELSDATVDELLGELLEQEGAIK